MAIQNSTPHYFLKDFKVKKKTRKHKKQRGPKESYKSKYRGQG